MNFHNTGPAGDAMLASTVMFVALALIYLISAVRSNTQEELVVDRNLGLYFLVIAFALLVVNGVANVTHQDFLTDREELRVIVAEDLADQSITLVDLGINHNNGLNGVTTVKWVEVQGEPGCVYRFSVAKKPDTGEYTLLLGSGDVVVDQRATELSDGTIYQPRCPEEYFPG